MKLQRTLSGKAYRVVTAALLWLTVPSVAFAGDEKVVYGMTPARLVSIMIALIGLASVIMGGLALRSSAGVRFRKQAATGTLVMGVVCIVLSLVQFTFSTGGFGSGSGKAGAIVALMLGVTGVVLGRKAWARTRKTVKDNINQVAHNHQIE